MHQTEQISFPSSYVNLTIFLSFFPRSNNFILPYRQIKVGLLRPTTGLPASEMEQKIWFYFLAMQFLLICFHNNQFYRNYNPFFLIILIIIYQLICL